MAVNRNQLGNQSPEIIGDSSFQPYRPHAASALSPYPAGSNDAQSATDSPLATGSEINDLPELEPLTADEELEMMQLLFPQEQPCQTMENAYNQILPQDQQLPNHWTQTVSYGAPNMAQPDMPLPLCGIINYSAGGLLHGHHPLQQSPQQPLAVLDPEIHRQMLGRARSFHSFQGSEPCAMALPPSRTGLITATVPAIGVGAPTVVTGAGRRGRGRGRGNGLPQRSAATGGRLRPILPVPTTDGLTMAFPARRNRAEESLSQVVSQRENLERHRRQMNQRFTTMRTPVRAYSLPATATLTRNDRARILREMMNFIFRWRLYRLRSSTLRTHE